MKIDDNILSKLDNLTLLIQDLQKKQDVSEERLTARIEGKSLALENKITLLNIRMEAMDHQIESVKLLIKSSQEDTIDALNALIHNGYNMHEKRIKALEKHTKLVS